MKIFTVTMTGTYFVEAESKDQANMKVFEALLGNPIYASILGTGEVDWANAKIEPGVNHIINHGDWYDNL
jgi:hypothetical protein